MSRRVPITLKSLIDRGPNPLILNTNWNEWEAENEQKIVASAQYLHHEIPIRLAGRIVDLESLPQTLAGAPSVLELRNMLLESFEEMVNSPKPVDRATERDFMAMQMKIREKHASMHGGIREALVDFSSESSAPDVTAILDKFYQSRIGIRMIVDQHIAIQQSNPGYIGILANECNPTQVTKKVVEDISKQCVEALEGQAPRFQVGGRADALFKYIPGHLAIILTEVIKNAVRNTISSRSPVESPLINIQVAGGERGVSVKVTDVGGGMHWEDVPQVWSYLHRTPKTGLSTSYDPVSSDLKKRMKELQFDDPFGMPIARLYARYFGGELTVMPMEGSGTDVYVHLKRLTDESKVN